MLNNKKLNVLFALIIAVALWLYVVGDVNPETNVTVKDVPVTFVNEDTLAAEGLTMLRSSVNSVDIKIYGQRSKVTRVNQSDFNVTADLEALKYGENVVRLKVSGPDNVDVKSISTEKTTITVDKLVTEERKVDVVFSGQTADDREPYVVEMSHEAVNVTGAKSLVSAALGVKATVNLDDIEDTLKTINAKLSIVDGNGQIVSGVTLDRQSVNVAVIMLQKKTVHLEVPVENLDSGDYQRQITTPKTIAIKGEAAALADITSITCETVDLQEVTENTTIALVPILPENVQVSTDSAELEAKVTVKSLGRQTFTFSSDDIEILNAKNGYLYEIEDAEIAVEVTGRDEDLKNITAADIKLTADVAQFHLGTHAVSIGVECSKPNNSVQPSVKEVDITIKSNNI